MKVRSSRNNRDGILVPFDTYERLREIDDAAARSMNVWLMLKHFAAMGWETRGGIIETEQFKALSDAGLATVRNGDIIVSDGAMGSKRMKWDKNINPGIVHKDEVYRLSRHWEGLHRRHIGCAPDTWSMQKMKPRLDAILSIKREDGSPMFLVADVEEAMDRTITVRKISHLNFLQSDLMQMALARNGNGKRRPAPFAPVAVYNLVGIAVEMVVQKGRPIDGVVGEQMYDATTGGFRAFTEDDAINVCHMIGENADAILREARAAGESGWEDVLRRWGVRYIEDAKSPVR